MKLLILLVLILSSFSANGQDSTYVLSAGSFNNGYLPLPEMTEWRFHEGSDTLWASPKYDHSSWQKLDSLSYVNLEVDEKGLFECWVAIRIKLDSSLLRIPLYLHVVNTAATDIYIDGELFHSFGNTNYEEGHFAGYSRSVGVLPNIALPINQDVLIAVHFVELHGSLFRGSGQILGRYPLLGLEKESLYLRFQEVYSQNRLRLVLLVSIYLLVSLLIWLVALLNPHQIHLKYAALTISFMLAGLSTFYYGSFLTQTSSLRYLLTILNFPLAATGLVFLVLLIAQVLEIRISPLIRVYLGSVIVMAFAKNFVPAISLNIMNLFPYSFLILCVYFFISRRGELKGSRLILAIGFGLSLLGFTTGLVINSIIGVTPWLSFFVTLMSPLSLLIYIAVWLREMVQEAKEEAQKVIQITEEKKILLENQNVELERQVTERTSELNTSLKHLKSTQSQLIQSEKMASLGELTAGIAHEIQNPLNFVNNFSDVNKELIQEIQDERQKTKDRDEELEGELLRDIGDNMEKINHHGHRADAIVKGMLQHSRDSGGEKEPTDINALADEYLRLSYHGLRAKDKSFNADYKLEADESVPKINVVPQDLGRVLLNLINNAFHAVNERAQKEPDTYKPTVTVTTTQSPPYQGGNKGGVVITVSDNGPGIPDSIRDKIFQPFFTTKATGEGTGLGLSLSYDIVTKGHGGTIKLQNKEPGTEFIVILPVG